MVAMMKPEKSGLVRPSTTSPKDERAERGVEEGAAVEAEQADGDERAAGDAAGVGDGGEEEEHADGGDEAGRDELAHGVGAESAHGVDLLGDLHGAELGGHAGGVAAGDHEAGEDGAELLDHGERDETAGHVDGAELLERGGGLEREYAAGEEAGEDDDGQRAEADVVHLGEGVGDVAGRREDGGDGVPGEQGVLLHRGDDAFGECLWGGKFHSVRCG